MRVLKLYIITIAIGILPFSCVQETYKRTVNFEVDMRGVEELESVGLRGSGFPLSWKEDHVIKDIDSTGFYRATVIFDTPYNFTEVKFVINDGQYELKGSANRKVYFNKEGVTEYKAVFDKEN